MLPLFRNDPVLRMLRQPAAGGQQTTVSPPQAVAPARLAPA
jgi:hypothetical protein